LFAAQSVVCRLSFIETNDKGEDLSPAELSVLSIGLDFDDWKKKKKE
jgi:hypothetical protein